MDGVDSAILVWFSSNTKPNRRGSIMVYVAEGPSVYTWYAGLAKEEGWRVLKTKGISTKDVQALIGRESVPGGA